MPQSIDIQLAENSFQLLADCGLFWPAQSILFIADTHFGKEATFRRSGIPVPRGTTSATLARIAGMLRLTEAKRLCILGDMFHAKSSIAAEIAELIEDFFDQFSTVEVSLVRGNHDARVGTLPSGWPIEVLDPGAMVERVALGHLPAALPTGADLYLCGHIHPAIRIGSRKDRIGKLPCFWHSQGQLVLPAVGEFTGTHTIQLANGDSAWVTAESQIYRYA